MTSGLQQAIDAAWEERDSIGFGHGITHGQLFTAHPIGGEAFIE